MKIKPVTTISTDRNRYCGPAVISAVTGMNSGEAARLIRSVSGQRAVRGAHTTHVRRALTLRNTASIEDALKDHARRLAERKQKFADHGPRVSGCRRPSLPTDRRKTDTSADEHVTS